MNRCYEVIWTSTLIFAILSQVMKKALLLCLLSYAGMAQIREFSVTTYNSLRYSTDNIDARHPHFRNIIHTIKPDILVLEEISGSNSATMFLDSVMNVDSTTYSLASFIDGPDLDAALYYKSAKFTALPTLSYPTTLRDIFQYRLIPDGSLDTLHVFGVHLKASSGSSNEARRAQEVAVLRSITNQFVDSINFLVCGDFNIYSSSEPAYQDLLFDTPANDGNFIDRIQISGTWNNSAYAQYHTQSPRTTQFNGGAHGGMDDRFDMILLSNALNSPAGMAYKPGSMYVFGNDGQHYNKAITDMPIGTDYDLSTRKDLHLASDHLPVVASFTYPVQYVSTVEKKPVGKVTLNYTREEEVWLQNPLQVNLNVQVYAMDGREVQKFSTSTDHNFKLETGVYLVVATHSGRKILTEKVMLQ